ncbi:MAG: bifunctional glutamate N-acetyltransferase/amino-acid acetyltransferase ArgJ [Pseudomonadota bacterium]
MAVGLSAPEQLVDIDGIDIATTEAGIRYEGRDDMVLMALAPGSTTAAVFTQNKVCAAPVTLAKANLQSQPARALLINAGNANAATGQQGLDNAQQCCVEVASLLAIDAEQVLPFSTGVIGEQLPMQTMGRGIHQLNQRLGKDGWIAAARAIMTTDTVAKGYSEQLTISNQSVSITGIAKGSGMICPDMATLLAYVATDAAIEQSVLEEMLHRVTAASFNRITVDSDTSTNDALVLVATGRSSMPRITAIDQAEAEQFYQAIERLMVNLATSIIRDAEGASKFVKIVVSGGYSESDCETIAYSVAHSPLVKTALFASDPNWGRLLMAIGKSPVEQLDIDRLSVAINDLSLIEKGQPASSYTEELGQAEFDQAEIEIQIDLGMGSSSYHVWTSDLSHDYVSINADYRS